ncbi:metal-dependent hydrolase [uncultured Planktosalinus sp.]|uniref:metal-dependent hydrolase n=1 Tax=uncultured Planktosalinus sp. TaxID=1810935 RepID=UPI0030D884C0
MDSLTQIVLGATVGEAVLGKKVGNKAMLYGAIAGTIPDLDVLANLFTDTITAIEIHRGFTHSIFFSVLFAPILGWLVSKIEKKSGVGWKGWSWLFFWTLITHPVLDGFTTWGTQFFWPFEYRVAFKNIFVIDPLYTIPFLFFLVLTMFQKRSSPKRQKYNRLGLIVSSCYLIITLVLKGVTYQKFTNALQEQNIYYRQIQTKPAPLNAILWTANVETSDAFLIGDYSLFDTQPITFYSFPKNHHLLGDWIHKPNIKRLIKIAEGGWFTISKKEENLFFNDLRFGLLNNDPENPEFTFSYKLIEKEGVIYAEETEKNREDAQKLMAELWERIMGN